VDVWTFPRASGEPLLVEVVLPIEAEGKVDLKSHRITYFPFGVHELLDRMKAAGFVDVETDYAAHRDAYRVTARAGGAA